MNQAVQHQRVVLGYNGCVKSVAVTLPMGKSGLADTRIIVIMNP